jgi:hypothetical protein
VCDSDASWPAATISGACGPPHFFVLTYPCHIESGVLILNCVHYIEAVLIEYLDGNCGHPEGHL